MGIGKVLRLVCRTWILGSWTVPWSGWSHFPQQTVTVREYRPSSNLGRTPIPIIHPDQRVSSSKAVSLRTRSGLTAGSWPQEMTLINSIQSRSLGVRSSQVLIDTGWTGNMKTSSVISRNTPGSPHTPWPSYADPCDPTRHESR